MTEEQKARCRAYYLKNREKILAKQKAQRDAETPEERQARLEYLQKMRDLNREHYREMNRKAAEKYKEKVRKKKQEMKFLSEHDIQDQIRDVLNLSNTTIWRVNVCSGFVGKYFRNSNGSVTIQNPRWISSGVPKGFPDLIGIKPVKITEDMVGKTIGQFVFIEVKAEHGRLTQEQKLFQTLLKSNGAIGGVARSTDDAINLIQ